MWFGGGYLELVEVTGGREVKDVTRAKGPNEDVRWEVQRIQQIIHVFRFVSC